MRKPFLQLFYEILNDPLAGSIVGEILDALISQIKHLSTSLIWDGNVALIKRFCTIVGAKLRGDNYGSFRQHWC